MSAIKRIVNVVIGVLMACCAMLMFADAENGYLLVVKFLEVALLVFGVQQLVYYFSMARHMVNGLGTFFKGIFLVDAGIFAICLDAMPRMFAMAYLLVMFGAAGAIGVVRSLEMKGLDAHWKLKFASGIVELLVAAACVVFIDSDALFSYAFAAGTLYLAIEKLITAFQKTAIVYVETQSAEEAVAASLASGKPVSLMRGE